MGSNITVNLLSNNPGSNGTLCEGKAVGSSAGVWTILEEDGLNKRDMVVG